MGKRRDGHTEWGSRDQQADQLPAMLHGELRYWLPLTLIHLHSDSYCAVAHTIGTTVRRRRLADRHFSESHFQMKHAYLVLASERRVFNVVLDDAPDAIHRAIGCRSVEHGTTFHTEDQLLIIGDELGCDRQDRFSATGRK